MMIKRCKTIQLGYFEYASPSSNLEETAHSQQQTMTTYYVDQKGQYYYKPSSDSDETVERQDPFVDTKIVGTPQEVGDAGNMDYFMLLPDKHALQTEQTLSIGNKELSASSITIYDFDDLEDRADEHDEQTDQDGTEVNDEVFVSFMGNTFRSQKRHRLAEYKCELCMYTSPRKYLLQRHMKCHSDERPHMCKVCERRFKTSISLNNHLNTHKGLKPHVCTYCDSAFTTSGELVRHVRYKHTHDKPHKCTECEYASVELSKLRRHMRCHTGERPYQCPQCRYASPDTFKLKRHLRTHTGEKPYKCHECNMTFTQSNSLKTHKLIHNFGEKPCYPCELCPATCGRKTDLRLHVQKLHTLVKPLKCTRCSKLFTDKYSYKVHNKTHEGEKCYKCSLCPYASTALRHLKSHLLKHTDEKPFVCEHCEQAFRQKQLLRRHENLYHNPDYVPPTPRVKCHRCHQCEKQFANKGNLIRHLAVHDPDRGLLLKTELADNVTSNELTEIIFEEGEEDNSSTVKLALDPSDMNLEKVYAISDTEEQIIVYRVVEASEYTEIHVVETQHEQHEDVTAATTPVTSPW